MLELGQPAHVAQTAGLLLDRLEPELVARDGVRVRSRSKAWSWVEVWVRPSGQDMIVSFMCALRW